MDRIAMMQQLAVRSSLSLREFCDQFCRYLELPKFHFDYENETEWGLLEIDNIEYNVSRPYDAGTLQEWNDSVPEGCNFGISLIVYREHAFSDDPDWAVEHFVPPVAQSLSDGFNAVVYFHGTWLRAGEYIRRTDSFHPRAA